MLARLPHFIDRHRDERRQALTAEFRVEGHGVPAGFGEQLVGFLEAGRGGHDAVLADATGPVADAVDRVENAGGELGGFVEDGLDEIDGTFLVAGQGADFFEAGHFVEDELHVAHRGDIGAHGLSPDCLVAGQTCGRPVAGTAWNRSATRP